MRKWMLALVVVALLVVPVVASVTTTRVTVANTATTLFSVQPFSQDVAIANRGSNPMFIGDSTVTTANGFQLDVNSTISFTAVANTAFFGIVASGTETAHVIVVN